MFTNSLRPEDKPKYVLNMHSNRPQVISKFLTVPGYAHAAFSAKFLMRFVRMDPVNLRAKFEVHSFTHSWDKSGYLKTVWAKFEVCSFTRSWDNTGYLNNFGQSLDTPTLSFLYNFECAYVRMDTVNWTAKFEVRSFTRSWDT